MALEEIPVDKCKKERMIWFLISVVGSIVSIVLITFGAAYNMRPKYGIYMVMLTYVITFASFVMYAFTQYISTKEIVSILIGKIRNVLGNDGNS